MRDPLDPQTQSLTEVGLVPTRSPDARVLLVTRGEAFPSEARITSQPRIALVALGLAYLHVQVWDE